MIGLTRQNIQIYVPKHLRSQALRLHDLGYEVNYRTVHSNPKKSHKARREVIDARNKSFTQLRLTVVWAAVKGPLLVLEGSVRDATGAQLNLFEIDNVDDFWEFAESGGKCPCGQVALSERSAKATLITFPHQKTPGEGSVGKEGRMYPCSRWRSVFHVAGIWVEPGA